MKGLIDESQDRIMSSTRKLDSEFKRISTKEPSSRRRIYRKSYRNHDDLDYDEEDEMVESYKRAEKELRESGNLFFQVKFLLLISLVVIAICI